MEEFIDGEEYSLESVVRNSILKYIDYDLFKQKSPIFIGYSDTTALALALYNKTGCIFWTNVK